MEEDDIVMVIDWFSDWFSDWFGRVGKIEYIEGNENEDEEIYEDWHKFNLAVEIKDNINKVTEIKFRESDLQIINDKIKVAQEIKGSILKEYNEQIASLEEEGLNLSVGMYMSSREGHLAQIDKYINQIILDDKNEKRRKQYKRKCIK
jgi:hypothetical protein